MRRFAAAWVCITALATPPPASCAAPPVLLVDEVAAGVFVHRGRALALDVAGHDDIANIGFIVGSRCIAVVDSGGSVRQGRALLAAIRARSTLPVCYVITTHGHVDHVLGNAAFRGSEVRFVGHARLADALRRSAAFFVAEYAADFDAPASPDQVVAPTIAVDGERVLDLGDRRLRVRAWPRSHTDSDLSVFDEKTSTLWTGDLLVRERLPAIDGSVRAWLDVMTTLAGFDVALVIPGHGPVTSDLGGTLRMQRDYLQALVDDVRKALASGQSLQQAIAVVGQSQRANWQLWEPTHPRNVMRVFQELEWE
jgi:quinoprotein relay system zinc metallohydrolase 2